MAITTTDGSKTLYTFLAETTPELVATGAYQTLRSKTGVKFDLNRETFESKERRSDRQVSALSYGNKSGSASIPIEWSYGSYDSFMEAVLGGTWTTNVLKIGNTARTFAVEETATELGITEQALGVQFSGFSISQKNSGIAEGDFTGVFRSLRAPQTKGVNIAIDATAKTITRTGAGFNTIDGFPLVTAGVPVLKVSMKGNANAGNNDTVWTVTTLTDTVMTFTTMTGAVTATAAAGIVVNNASVSSSVVAASTLAPFDSFTGTITEGGAVIAHVTGWDLKVDQEVKLNHANGSDTAQSSSVGGIKVSGNLSVYYIDQALRKKFVNGTSSSLSLVMGSIAATKAYTFSLGTIKYSSNSRDDNELARTETLAFTATYTDTDTALKITRTP